jgi:hypothetical protein
MLPNASPNPLARLNDLLNSIKRVYASTFYQGTKDYFRVTSYRLEEEKMAVIVQKMVGTQHRNLFYPHFAGVGKAYNFYPIPPQKAADGVVSVALGLGKMVVDGGSAVRFCPKYPTDLIQFYSVEETINSTQRRFYALQMDARTDFGAETHDVLTTLHDLDTAEADGTLRFVGSTYSPDNDTIYDGLARPGIRIVSFHPILRHRVFPLAPILELILDMGTWGMGTPVEVEFAGNLTPATGALREFALLQMRPLVIHREPEALSVEVPDRSQLLCESTMVLGNGLIDDIRDIVAVDVHAFDRAHSREVAQEVSQFNSRLIGEQRPYLLIGVGRWGSLDPWLGIPVAWKDIAGARAIVETGFKEIAVAPSQGTHFFQNITSFMVGYFTVNPHAHLGFLDWDWLLHQAPLETARWTRLVRLNRQLTIRINGHLNKGVILKPEPGNDR